MPPQERNGPRRIFAITWLAYAGFYLCRKNLSVLIPVLESTRAITKLQLANIVFLYSVAYAAGQFLIGPVSDRYGPRRIVTLGLLTSAAANLAMGLTGLYPWLLLLGLINGLAQSTGWPALVKNMAAWFAPAQRGVVMGWWTTNYVAGGFLATVIAAWAISHPGPLAPWRAGFISPALLLIVVAILFARHARDTPADAGRPNLEPEPAPTHTQDPWRDYLDLLRHKPVWVTALTALSLKIIRYSFLFWLPLYMTEALRYGPEQAGYSSSVFDLAGSAGALLAGYASDRLFHARRFPVASLMLIGLAAACAGHSYLAALGWAGNLTGIVLIGIMTYGPDTLMQGPASQDIGRQQHAALAAGLVCGIASLGQLVAPYLVAEVTGRYGWATLFRLFVLLSLATSALSAVNWNFRPLTVQLNETPQQ